MSFKPSCQKIMRMEPEKVPLTVEEYVRAPCMTLVPPCNRKIRSPEPEPEMPICPCPPPSLPPCRFRPDDDECCKVIGSKPRRFPKAIEN